MVWWTGRTIKRRMVRPHFNSELDFGTHGASNAQPLRRVLQAPAGSFGSAIYVPTPEGFTDAPGCVESYAATATFRLYTKGDKADGDGVSRPLVLREEVEFKVGEDTRRR